MHLAQILRHVERGLGDVTKRPGVLGSGAEQLIRQFILARTVRSQSTLTWQYPQVRAADGYMFVNVVSDDRVCYLRNKKCVICLIRIHLVFCDNVVTWNPQQKAPRE